jgi:hypothetical protein
LQGEVIPHPQNPKDYSFDFHPIYFPPIMVLALKTPTRLSGYRSAINFCELRTHLTNSERVRCWRFGAAARREEEEYPSMDL